MDAFPYDYSSGPVPLATVSPPRPTQPNSAFVTAPILNTLPAWLCNYCLQQGMCTDHTHYAGHVDGMGPLVITLPTKALEHSGNVGTAVGDTPGSPMAAATSYATVRTSHGPTKVAIPRSSNLITAANSGHHSSSAGSSGSGSSGSRAKQSFANTVLQNVLEQYAHSTEQHGWLSAKASDLTLCQDKRLCFAASKMDMSYHFAGETAVELIMVDDPMCKAIVDKLLGETIVVSEGKSADASLVQSSKPTSVGKQRHLLDELLSTEDSYLNHLKILKTIYHDQLSEHVDEPDPPLNRPELNVVFKGIDRIISINEAFYRDLKDALQPERSGSKAPRLTFEQVFELHIKSFTEYTNFVNYYQSSLQTLELRRLESARLRDFLESCYNLPNCKQDINSLLIAPIQRLGRYDLFLKTILECTNVDDPQYGKLKAVREKMQAAAAYVNKTKEVADTQMNLFRIQVEIVDCPPTLVKATRGYLGRIDGQQCDQSGKTESKYWSLFLFDDYLLIASKQNKTWSKKESRKFERLIDVSKISVTTYPNRSDLVTLTFPSKSGLTMEILSVVMHGEPFDSKTERGFKDIAMFGSEMTKATMDLKQRTGFVQFVKRERFGYKIEFAVRSPFSAKAFKKETSPFPQNQGVTVVVLPDTPVDLSELLPARVFEDSYMLILIQCARNGGFKISAHTRFNQLPSIGPDLRGEFDSDAASNLGPVIMEKILRGQHAYAVNILHLENYVVNHYSMWLDHLLSTASFHHIQHASSSSRRPSISSMISTSSNSLVEKASSPIKSLVTASLKRSSTITSVKEAVNSLKPVLRTFSLSRDPVTPKKRSPLKAAAVPVELQNLLRLIESIEQESNNPNNSIYQPLPNNTSPKKQKEHAQKTRESVDQLLPSNKDVLIATAALKKANASSRCAALIAYLERFYAPLIPSGLMDDVVQACNWQYSIESISLLQKTLVHAPVSQLTTMRYVLLHLRRLCDHPGNSCNFLSLDEMFKSVFLPTTIVSSSASDFAGITAVQEQMPTIVATLIEHVHDIFTEDLMDQAADSSSVPATLMAVDNADPTVVVEKLNGETKRRRITPTTPLEVIINNHMANGSSRLSIVTDAASVVAESPMISTPASSSVPCTPVEIAATPSEKENSAAEPMLPPTPTALSSGIRKGGMLGSLAEASLARRQGRSKSARSSVVIPNTDPMEENIAQ